MRKVARVGIAGLACGAWVILLSAAQRTTPPPKSSGESTPPTKLGAHSTAGRGPAATVQDQGTVRRVFDDLFNQGRYELVDTLYARECPVHTGGKTVRLEDSVAEGKGWRQAFPDLHLTVGEVSTRGDRVVVAWTAAGTHTGQGNGLRPSGKHVMVHGRSAFRMANGRIAEVWNHYNRDSLYRQMGVNPTVGRLFETLQDLWALVHGWVDGRPRPA